DRDVVLVNFNYRLGVLEKIDITIFWKKKVTELRKKRISHKPPSQRQNKVEIK
ncbi:unnamed protein product, partial [Allacma fusca]